MVRELLYELYTAHRQLVGTGAVIVLFIAALLALALVYGGKNRGNAPVALSPLCVIAVGMAEFTDMFISRFKKPVYALAAGIFAVCLCVLAITSSGTGIVSDELSTVSDNDMHLPTGLAGAMDAILADSGDPAVLTMPEWGIYLEAYSSRFSLMYEEPEGGDLSGLDEDSWNAYTELSIVHPDMKKVAMAAHRKGCTYVLLSDPLWPEKPITQYGYEPFYEGVSCCVYREVKSP